MRKALWYLAAVLCVALTLLLTRPVPASSLMLPIQLDAVVELHTSTAKCTGFIMRRNLIVTAGHCVHPADPMRMVKFTNGTIQPYTIVASQFNNPPDCAHDWAIIRTDTGTRAPLLFGLRPKQGDTIMRIGYPQGYHKQVARIGRVTALENDYIETSNVASPGESGAPMLDGAGQVVGVLDCFDSRVDTALGGEARLFRAAVEAQ